MLARMAFRRGISGFNRSVLKRQPMKFMSSENVPGAYIGVPVSVKAYYIARGIEIMKVHTNIYGTSAQQDFQSKSVTITIDEDLSQYISVFKYGSVVMFNIPEGEK